MGNKRAWNSYNKPEYKDFTVADNTTQESESKPTLIETEEAKPIKTETVAAVAKAIAPVQEETEEKKETPQIPKIARIKEDLVNVRQRAKADAAIVQTVTRGAEFKVVDGESKNGFTAVSVNGSTAYIRSDLLEVFDNPIYVAHQTIGTIGA